MYICKNCDTLLEELKHTFYTDYDTCFQGRNYVCPHCGSDDIADAVKCKGCEQWHIEDELTEGYCVECEKKIQDKVTEFFKQFNEDEKTYIFESGILQEV